MENLRLWVIFLFTFWCAQYCFSQVNESHIVTAATKDLKIILLSSGRPVMEGTVVIENNMMINHGMFIVYRQDGTIKETVLYNMGKIIEIVKFDRKEKI